MLSETSVTPAEPADLSLFPTLKEKKIIYDGDSIAASYRELNGGGYPALIVNLTDSTYRNFAKGSGRLCSSDTAHSVVDNLKKLPTDGDLYCFEGGINDFGTIPL